MFVFYYWFCIYIIGTIKATDSSLTLEVNAGFSQGDISVSSFEFLLKVITEQSKCEPDLFQDTGISFSSFLDFLTEQPKPVFISILRACKAMLPVNTLPQKAQEYTFEYAVLAEEFKLAIAHFSPKIHDEFLTKYFEDVRDSKISIEWDSFLPFLTRVVILGYKFPLNFLSFSHVSAIRVNNKDFSKISHFKDMAKEVLSAYNEVKLVSLLNQKVLKLITGDFWIQDLKKDGIKYEGYPFREAVKIITEILRIIKIKYQDQLEKEKDEFENVLKSFDNLNLIFALMAPFVYSNARMSKPPVQPTQTPLQLHTKIGQSISETGKFNRKSICLIIKSLFENLLPGEKLLLPFGWVEVLGGHAMLLEISLNSMKELNMEIFNSGDGIQYHFTKYDYERMSVLPNMIFEGIPLSRLEENLFYEGFADLLLPIDKESYSSADIYESLLEPYYPNLKIDQTKDEHYMVPQIAGTCVFSCQKAYLASKLYHVFESKLNIFIDYETIDASFSLFPNSVHVDLLIEALDRAVQSLSRRNSSLYTSAITHSLLESFALRVKKLQQTLKNTVINRELPVIGNVITVNLPAMDPPFKVLGTGSTTVGVLNPFLFTPFILSISNLQDLLLSDIQYHLKIETYETFMISTVNLSVTREELLKEYGNDLNTLDFVLTKYLHLCAENGTPLTYRRAIALLKTVALAWRIIEVEEVFSKDSLPTSNITSFWLEIEMFTSHIDTPTFIPSSSIEIAEYQSALNYLGRFRSTDRAAIFSFNHYVEKRGDFNFHDLSSSDALFLETFIKTSTDHKEFISWLKSFEGYQQLHNISLPTNQIIQNFYVFCGKVSNDFINFLGPKYKAFRDLQKIYFKSIVGLASAPKTQRYNFDYGTKVTRLSNDIGLLGLEPFGKNSSELFLSTKAQVKWAFFPFECPDESIIFENIRKYDINDNNQNMVILEKRLDYLEIYTSKELSGIFAIDYLQEYPQLLQQPKYQYFLSLTLLNPKFRSSSFSTDSKAQYIYSSIMKHYFILRQEITCVFQEEDLLKYFNSMSFLVWLYTRLRSLDIFRIAISDKTEWLRLHYQKCFLEEFPSVLENLESRSKFYDVLTMSFHGAFSSASALEYIKIIIDRARYSVSINHIVLDSLHNNGLRLAEHLDQAEKSFHQVGIAGLEYFHGKKVELDCSIASRMEYVCLVDSNKLLLNLLTGDIYTNGISNSYPLNLIKSDLFQSTFSDLASNWKQVTFRNYDDNVSVWYGKNGEKIGSFNFSARYNSIRSIIELNGQSCEYSSTKYLRIQPEKVVFWRCNSFLAATNQNRKILWTFDSHSLLSLAEDYSRFLKITFVVSDFTIGTLPQTYFDIDLEHGIYMHKDEKQLVFFSRFYEDDIKNGPIIFENRNGLWKWTSDPNYWIDKDQNHLFWLQYKRPLILTNQENRRKAIIAIKSPDDIMNPEDADTDSFPICIFDIEDGDFATLDRASYLYLAQDLLLHRFYKRAFQAYLDIKHILPFSDTELKYLAFGFTQLKITKDNRPESISLRVLIAYLVWIDQKWFPEKWKIEKELLESDKVITGFKKEYNWRLFWLDKTSWKLDLKEGEYASSSSMVRRALESYYNSIENMPHSMRIHYVQSGFCLLSEYEEIAWINHIRETGYKFTVGVERIAHLAGNPLLKPGWPSFSYPTNEVVFDPSFVPDPKEFERKEERYNVLRPSKYDMHQVYIRSFGSTGNVLRPYYILSKFSKLLEVQQLRPLIHYKSKFTKPTKMIDYVHTFLIPERTHFTEPENYYPVLANSSVPRFNQDNEDDFKSPEFLLESICDSKTQTIKAMETKYMDGKWQKELHSGFELNKSSPKYSLCRMHRSKVVMDKDRKLELKSGKELDIASFLSTTISKGREMEIQVTNARKDIRAFIESTFSERQRTSKIGKFQRIPKLTMLLHAFARDDINSYKFLLPELNLEQVSKLRSSLGYYLHLLSESQHINRILKHLQAIRALKQSDDEIQLLGEELRAKAQRHYNIWKMPFLAVFEASMNFRLREDQTSALKRILDCKMVDKNCKYDSIILQMLMAAGKTLVVGTNLAFAMADGFYLPVVIPPSSLFITNTQDMCRRSMKIFGQECLPVVYDRSLEKYSVEFLGWLLYSLKRIIEKRGYVIISPESLQSLQNRFVENLYSNALNATDMPQDEKQKLQLLQNILSLFLERGLGIFDEIDMIFSPMRELNFPTREVEPIDAKAITIVTQIFHWLAFDGEILKLGVNIRGSAFKFQRDNWHNVVERIVALLCVTKVRSFLNMTCEQLSWFYSKKSHSSGIPDWLNELKGSIDYESSQVFNRILVLHHLLYTTIPESLSFTVNLHFGLSRNIPADGKYVQIAKPYIAANTPNENAEFSDKWETVCKTLITYIQTGLGSINRQQMMDFIHFYKSKLSFDISRGISPEQSKLAQEYQEAFGAPLLNATIKDKSFTDALLNFNTERGELVLKLVLEFIRLRILNPITSFPLQIYSTPMNLGSMFATHIGYTGTIYEPFIYYHSIVHNDKILFDYGANGRIMDYILRYNNRIQIIADDFRIEDILSSFKNSFKDEFLTLTALIDVGAILKKYTNFQVAIAILNYFIQSANERIKGALFYDNDSNRLSFLKKGSLVFDSLPGTSSEIILKYTGLKHEEIFTYFDHRHITGADIKQPFNAHALVTVGFDYTLRDLLQGLMRMRNFLFSQKISFIIQKAVYEHIWANYAQDKEVEHVIRYGIVNSKIAESKFHIRAAFHKIHNAIRERAFKDLLKNTPSIWNTFLSAKNVFIRDCNVNLEDAIFGVQIESKIDSLLMVYSQSIMPEYILNEEGGLKTNLKEICSSASSFIEEKVNSMERLTLVNGSSVEQQLDLDTDLDIQFHINKHLDQTLQGLQPGTHDYWVLEKNDFPSILKSKTKPVNSVILGGQFAIFANIFSSQLLITNNYLSTIIYGTNLLDNFRKFIQYLLIFLHDNILKCIILSNRDAIEFSKHLNDHSENAVLINLQNLEIAGNFDKGLKSTFEKDTKSLITQASFLSASFSSLNYETFENWSQSDDQTFLRSLFLEMVILPHYRKSLPEYFSDALIPQKKQKALPPAQIFKLLSRLEGPEATAIKYSKHLSTCGFASQDFDANFDAIYSIFHVLKSLKVRLRFLSSVFAKFPIVKNDDYVKVATLGGKLMNEKEFLVLSNFLLERKSKKALFGLLVTQRYKSKEHDTFKMFVLELFNIFGQDQEEILLLMNPFYKSNELLFDLIRFNNSPLAKHSVKDLRYLVLKECFSRKVDIMKLHSFLLEICGDEFDKAILDDLNLKNAPWFTFEYILFHQDPARKILSPASVFDLMASKLMAVDVMPKLMNYLTLKGFNQSEFRDIFGTFSSIFRNIEFIDERTAFLISFLGTCPTSLSDEEYELIATLPSSSFIEPELKIIENFLFDRNCKFGLLRMFKHIISKKLQLSEFSKRLYKILDAEEKLVYKSHLKAVNIKQLGILIKETLDMRELRESFIEILFDYVNHNCTANVLSECYMLCKTVAIRERFIEMLEKWYDESTCEVYRFIYALHDDALLEFAIANALSSFPKILQCSEVLAVFCKFPLEFFQDRIIPALRETGLPLFAKTMANSAAYTCSTEYLKEYALLIVSRESLGYIFESRLSWIVLDVRIQRFLLYNHCPSNILAFISKQPNLEIDLLPQLMYLIPSSPQDITPQSLLLKALLQKTNAKENDTLLKELSNSSPKEKTYITLACFYSISIKGDSAFTLRWLSQKPEIELNDDLALHLIQSNPASDEYFKLVLPFHAFLMKEHSDLFLSRAFQTVERFKIVMNEIPQIFAMIESGDMAHKYLMALELNKEDLDIACNAMSENKYDNLFLDLFVKYFVKVQEILEPSTTIQNRFQLISPVSLSILQSLNLIYEHFSALVQTVVMNQDKLAAVYDLEIQAKRSTESEKKDAIDLMQTLVANQK